MYILMGTSFCLLALFLCVSSANSLTYHQHVNESSVSPNSVTSELPILDSSQQEKRQLIVRILALFTGSSVDLGLDHRLGRQVLKLAVGRALRLSPEVSDVQLIVYNDSSECKSGASGILGQLAHEFYAGQAQDDTESCGSISPMSDDQEYEPSGRCKHSTISQITARANAGLNRIDAILGPSCDHLIDSVARMAAYWRTPIYTVTSINGAFRHKDVYPTLTRLSPSIDHLSLFIMTVMERFKWRHLAIVADHGQLENMAILANLERTIDRMRYTIPVDRKTFSFSSFAVNNSVIQDDPSQALHGNQTGELAVELIGSGDPLLHTSQMHCSRESRELLLSVRRFARIVLLLVNNPQVIRRLLLCAHELRFNNGEYTFLALNLGLKSTSSTGGGVSSGRQQQQAGGQRQTFDWFAEDDESNNLLARQMFESLMVFSVELPASNEYNIFVEQTLDLAQQEYPDAHFDHSSVGLVAVALHDSLLLAVEAQRRHFISSGATNNSESKTTLANLKDSSEYSDEFEDLEDEQQAKRVNRKVPLLWDERYPYGLISGMHINGNGDQELDYVLSDMEPELGLFRPVASYSKEARQIQMLPSSYIHWPARVNAATQQVLHNDEPPPDEPECGFTGEAQHCVDRQNLFTALAILALFLLCSMLIAVVSLQRYRKIKYQMKLDDYWWKINWADLEFLQVHRNSLTSNLASSLVRQLRGTDAADARSIVGGLGRHSLVGSAISSAAKRRSLASSDGSHTQKPAAAAGAFRTPTGGPTAANFSKRRSAVSLVVTPASGGGHKDEEEEKEEEKDQDEWGDVHGQDNQSGVHRQQHQSQVCTSQVGKSSVFHDRSSRVIRSEFSTVVRVSSLALYKGEIVIVKQLNGSSIEVSRELLIELKGMRELSNENLARLVGLCLDPGHLSMVYEYCSRGNLQDLLLNTSISMDWNLKYSIIGDILNGLNFIHTTLLDHHGRLKSTNLVLDSRFTVKLTDFGLKSLYNQLELIENNDDDDDNDEEEDIEQNLVNQLGANTMGGNLHGGDAGSDTLRRQSMAPTIYNMDSVSMRAENFASSSQGNHSSNFLGGSNVDASEQARLLLKNRGSARFFWTAPEHLRQRRPHLAGSKRGDVYSMAIILYEIFTRKQPYHFGTNAKPSWQVIKRDKLRHQSQGQQARKQQLQHQGLIGGESSVGQHGELGGGSDASQLMAGRGASFSRKRGSSQASGVAVKDTHHKSSSMLTRARKRRSNASVSPMQPVDGAAADGAESCATHSSSSSVRRVQEPAGATDQVRINVSAFVTSCEANTIGEVLREGDEAEERSSIASNQQGQDAIASKRRMSDISCLSQEFKSGGAARLKLKTAPDAGEGAKLDAEEILDQLRMGIQPEPVRPYIPNYLLQDIDPRMMSLLRNCWHEQPATRPTINHVRNTMRKITKGATAKNYLDNLLDRLQTYASQLEIIVDSKSADITAEKERTEELLYQLVPRFVADKLKRSEPIIPQVFDGVTIFFSDIVGFENYASVMSPCELVDLLNNIYSSFDSIISSFDVTKIEVILDQFLVASGISLEQQQQQQQQHQQEHHSEQPTEGAKEGANGAVPEQGQTSGSEKPKSVKSRRRILGSLRGGSQSIDSKKASSRQEDSDAKPNAQAEQASNGADLSHYNRLCCEQIARMALCIRDLVKSFHFRQNLSSTQQTSGKQNDANGAENPANGGGGGGFVATNFNIRIGIHSGKVCAGIVGVKRPKFCLIGDTVNVASRMHTNSKANRIQISASTRELLKQVPGFAIEPRGRIEIKGKGMMETFWLESAY